MDERPDEKIQTFDSFLITSMHAWQMIPQIEDETKSTLTIILSDLWEMNDE